MTLPFMQRLAVCTPLASVGSLALAVLAAACAPDAPPAAAGESTTRPPPDSPYAVVLGVAQDGGHPQAGTKPGEAWDPERRRYATSIAVVDPTTRERWLFEATPDFRYQLHDLDRIAAVDGVPGLAGILLTHAHVGHYAGLIHIGHEIIGARGVPVHALPRMREFLSAHGPWDQLVRFGNIELRPLEDGVTVALNERIRVTPFRVPHRDEYSETVGFRIEGPDRSVIFLPDIDKWDRWDEWGVRIEDVVAASDVAYLDGTFYADGEIPGRDMAAIPHPFIVETMQRFRHAPADVRQRIRFIHLNRTNPALFADTDARRAIEAAGMRVAERLEIVRL